MSNSMDAHARSGEESPQLAGQHTGEPRMSILKLTAHRAWEDWFLLALGIAICISPSLADRGYNDLPAASAVIAGLIIILVAQLEIVALSRWEEIINLICGAWIAAAPLILRYFGQLRFWHFGLGGFVLIITLFEVWQDKKKGGAIT
jgi:predicted MFS family arabinose efflux permease